MPFLIELGLCLLISAITILSFFFLNLSFTFSFKVVISQNNVIFYFILFYFILFYFISYESETHLVVSYSFWSHGLFSPWNPPGQNTRVGSFSLLQGIFLTQGSVRGVCNFLDSVSSQQKHEATDVKAFWQMMSQLSERPCYSSQTDQCHNSVLQLSFI